MAAGCVTERIVRPSPGLGGGGSVSRGSGDGVAGSSASGGAAGGGTTVAARSVADAGSGRVLFAMQALGEVPYDGQTLPLISTGADGGRWVASQVGPPASWGAVLAEPGRTAGLSRVSVFDLAARPVAPPAWASSMAAGTLPALSPGYLLGRGADAQGFLIELPRPDGSRWLGRVAWETGAVSWLVQDAWCNAHAVPLGGPAGGAGEIVYTRRAAMAEGGGAVGGAGSGASELVHRAVDGTVRVLLPLAGGVAGASRPPEARAGDRPSYHLPVVSADGRHVVVWEVWPAVGGEGAPATSLPGALRLVWLARSGDGGGWAIAGEPLPMGRGTVADAYQAVAAIEAAPPPATGEPPAVSAGAGSPAAPDPAQAIGRGVVFLSPLTGEMVWQPSPTQVPGALGVGVGGAARVAGLGGVGWSLAGREGLVFAPLVVGAPAPGAVATEGTLLWSLLPSTQLQRGAALPRQTGRADGRIVSIAPAPASGETAGGSSAGGTRGPLMLRLWSLTVVPVGATEPSRPSGAVGPGGPSGASGGG